MNLKNLFQNNNEENDEPRSLDSMTIKKIESIAYTKKENMETDVKIWIPK